MSQLDLRRDGEKQLKKIGHKYKRDAKLQELEKQLEFAESRCGTLKQQLEYIKLLYRCGRDPNLENRCPKEEGHGDGSVINQLNCNEFSKWSHQNQNFINREDGDGPALIKRTSYSNTTTTISSTKHVNQEITEIKKKSPKPKANGKIVKIKKKSCKRGKKKRKVEDTASSKVSNASSQTQSQICHDPVVEIYKNTAANAESESGLETLKHQKPRESWKQIKPAIKNGSSRQSFEIKDDAKAKSLNSLTPRKGANLPPEEGQERDFATDHSKPTEGEEPLNDENNFKPESVCLDPVKSYCKPTISSKRKQVERDIYSNLTNLNIRNLPFVAARSTAPSHNIGVNIQQVLSIIKKRQPLSENLQNVGGEGRVLNNPVAALLSSRKIGSKTNGTVSAPATGVSSVWGSKISSEKPRESISHWKSNSEIDKPPAAPPDDKPDPKEGDWSLKVDKLKRVLVFLHEDFSSLSRKYKRLQKKLTKRNITKTDAKDELAEIERDLERKEEEITVVIALYKEVINLKENYKKLQDKYDLLTSGRIFMVDGIKQSNSAHTQMTALLRKIQGFQAKLKG